MRRYVPQGWRVNKYRWFEMLDVCRQYQQLKRDADDIRNSYSASMSGSIAVQSSSDASPVERKVDRLLKITAKIDLIDDCCRDATKDEPVLYQCIHDNVTEGIPYSSMDVPCNKNEFTAFRQYFFYILDQRL